MAADTRPPRLRSAGLLTRRLAGEEGALAGSGEEAQVLGLGLGRHREAGLAASARTAGFSARRAGSASARAKRERARRACTSGPCRDRRRRAAGRRRAARVVTGGQTAAPSPSATRASRRGGRGRCTARTGSGSRRRRGRRGTAARRLRGELVAQVEGEVREAEVSSQGALERASRTALDEQQLTPPGRCRRRARAPASPRAPRRPRPLPAHQQRGDRAVHAPAHGDEGPRLRAGLEARPSARTPPSRERRASASTASSAVCSLPGLEPADPGRRSRASRPAPPRSPAEPRGERDRSPASGRPRHGPRSRWPRSPPPRRGLPVDGHPYAGDVAAARAAGACRVNDAGGTWPRPRG